jgi:hypothetical protein
MLFVAEYEFEWDDLDAVVAKRIELESALPEGFRFVGEYIWADRDPAFRGIAIIDADSIDALNAFVLHYGPSLSVRAHPATDVASGISQVNGAAEMPRRRRKLKRS